mmetsp:Transcript_28847/g.73977  ORF Transcript_28847/g.73977 Transcript_28847/m.73977 type:complete len:306 (-) Transcript_28847:107-1024(-)
MSIWRQRLRHTLNQPYLPSPSQRQAELPAEEVNSFMIACFNGITEEVRSRLVANPALRVQPDRYGWKPSFYALQGGHLDVLMILEQHGVVLKEEKGPRGWSLLHYACFEGFIEAARFLVEDVGCDPSARSDDGFTPARCAAAGGHVPILEFLREKGVKLAQERDNNDVTLLEVACQAGSESIVRYLVEQVGCDLSARCASRGWTATFYALASGHPHVLALLQELGVVLKNETDARGYNLIEQAEGHLSPRREARGLASEECVDAEGHLDAQRPMPHYEEKMGTAKRPGRGSYTDEGKSAKRRKKE